MANEWWREKFLASTITHLFSHASDHHPLVLQTKSYWRIQSNGTQAFKFEESWLLWDDCEKMVFEAWNNVNNAHLGLNNTKERINISRDELSTWGSPKTHPDAEEIKKVQK